VSRFVITGCLEFPRSGVHVDRQAGTVWFRLPETGGADPRSYADVTLFRPDVDMLIDLLALARAELDRPHHALLRELGSGGDDAPAWGTTQVSAEGER
jgi:hypothetical protein